MNASPYSRIIRYVMELELSPAEIQAIEPIQHQVCAIVGLVNDYCSWPKEKAAMGDQLERLMHGVSVLVRLEVVDKCKALEMIRGLAMEHEEKLIELC